MSQARGMSRSRGLWTAVLVGLAAALLVGAGFAYTAANTVDETKGGEGTGVVSGYNVASVHYTLNTADPTKIDAVAFSLDSAPVVGSTIRVRLIPAGTFYTCTNTGVAVTCPTTSPQGVVSTTSALTVVVAQ